MASKTVPSLLFSESVHGQWFLYGQFNPFRQSEVLPSSTIVLFLILFVFKLVLAILTNRQSALLCAKNDRNVILKIVHLYLDFHTGRNCAFPYFWNVVETWTSLSLIRFREVETRDTNYRCIFFVSVVFPERNAAVRFGHVSESLLITSIYWIWLS